MNDNIENANENEVKELDNYKEALEKLRIEQARLLYIIFYLSETLKISDEERLKLKEYLYYKNDILFKLYRKFEDNLDLDLFASKIKATFFEESKKIDVKKLQIITKKNSKKLETGKNDIQIVNSGADAEEVLLLNIILYILVNFTNRRRT